MNQISNQALVMFMNNIIDIHHETIEMPVEKPTKPSTSRWIPVHTLHYFSDDFKLESNPGLHGFFKKILVAVELRETQYSVANSYKSEEKHAHIGWGTSPVDNLELYHPKTIGNEIFLRVDSLQTIENDKNLKTKLWQSLKQIYDK